VGTTGNGYTRGSGGAESLTYGYGSGNNLLATGRVVKTVYLQTPNNHA